MEAGERAELEALRDWVAASPGGPIECRAAAAAPSPCVAPRFPARELNRIVGLYDLADARRARSVLRGRVVLGLARSRGGARRRAASARVRRGLRVAEVRARARAGRGAHGSSRRRRRVARRFRTAFAEGYGLPAGARPTSPRPSSAGRAGTASSRTTDARPSPPARSSRAATPAGSAPPRRCRPTAAAARRARSSPRASSGHASAACTCSITETGVPRDGQSRRVLSQHRQERLPADVRPAELRLAG